MKLGCQCILFGAAGVLLGFSFVLTEPISLQDNISVGYSLVVNSTSPAVFDSNITFLAVLHETAAAVEHDDTYGNPTIYLYQWKHNATGHSMDSNVTTEGGQNSSLSVIFPGDSNVTVGIYKMEVEVFVQGNEEEDPLTLATTFFQITDVLNVALSLNQSSDVILPLGVFATKENISVDLWLHDTFENATYNYTWLLDDRTLNTTSCPSLNFSVSENGTHNLTVHVTAIVSLDPSTSVGDVVYKRAVVSQKLMLKDRITYIHYMGATTYRRGDRLLGNLTCDGSPSLKLCVNITCQGRSAGYQCFSLDPSAGCLVQLSEGNLVFTEDGTYTMNVFVQNDVSNNQTNIMLTVLAPDPGGEAMVAVFCVLIGIAAVALLAYSHYRDKRSAAPNTESQETADFNFIMPHSRRRSIAEDFQSAWHKARMKGHQFAENIQTGISHCFSTESHSDCEDSSSTEYINGRTQGYGSVSDISA